MGAAFAINSFAPIEHSGCRDMGFVCNQGVSECVETAVRNDAVPETAAPVGLLLVCDQDPMPPTIYDDPESTRSSTHPSQKRQKKTKASFQGGDPLAGWSAKKKNEGPRRACLSLLHVD